MTFQQWNAFTELAFDSLTKNQSKSIADFDQISVEQCPLVNELNAMPQIDALVLGVIIDVSHSFPNEWVEWESIPGWFDNYNCDYKDIDASINRLHKQGLIIIAPRMDGFINAAPNFEQLEEQGFLDQKV